MKKIYGILVGILMIVSSFITISSAKIETPNNSLNTTKVNKNTNSPPEITSIEYRGTIKEYNGLYLCEWKVYFNDPDGDYVTLFFKTNDSGNWDYRPHDAHLVDHFFFSFWIELGTHTAYFYVEDVTLLKSDTISYTYDVTKTKSINQNLNENIGLIKPFNEKVSTSISDPLTIRVETEQIGYRIWLLKAYLKNTWQEKITVKWTYIPCFFAVSYIVPDEEDLEIPVYIPYHGFIYQFTPFFKFFKPGEEKLVQIAIFYGKTNWANSLKADNLTHYFPDFPILPEGDYRFEAIINPYYVNSEGRQHIMLVCDNIVFRLASPK